MAATTPKNNRPRRKTEKRYTLVTFELDFLEGEFELPSFTQIPLGVQRRIVDDINVLYSFIEKHAPDGAEQVEVMDEFDGDENAKFMEAWSKASGADLPK